MKPHEGIQARKDFIESVNPVVEEIRKLKMKARGILPEDKKKEAS